jgi:hypothetical protein
MVSIWPTATNIVDLTAPRLVSKKDETVYINDNTVFSYLFEKKCTSFIRLIENAKMFDLYNNPENHMTFVVTPEDRISDDEFVHLVNSNFNNAREMVNYSTIPKNLGLYGFGSVTNAEIKTACTYRKLNWKKINGECYINGVRIIDTIVKPTYTIYVMDGLTFNPM